MENMWDDSVRQEKKRYFRNSVKTPTAALNDEGVSRNSTKLYGLTSKSGRRESKIPIPNYSTKMRSQNMSWESIKNKDENVNPWLKNTVYGKYAEFNILNEDDNINSQK